MKPLTVPLKIERPGGDGHAHATMTTLDEEVRRDQITGAAHREIRSKATAT